MGSADRHTVIVLAAHSAPIIGFVVWLTPFSLTAGLPGWDFPKYFMLGAYMAAAGLAISLLLWFTQAAARPELWRVTKFQGILLAAASLLFAGAHAAGAFAGHPNPNPPSFVTTAMTMIFVVAGVLLPVVEIGWMLSGILRVLQGSRIAD